eukprot:Rhum_TRINITY_DN14824_c10_g10::Rhum_TRINITY_DN14824_c10_g10_i1::g.119419::m.119419
MLGADGVGVRCLEALFAAGASALELQAVEIRLDACKDLLTGRAGVRVSVDDKQGASIDAETASCRTLAAASATLLEAAAAVEEPALAHFVASVTAFRGGKVCGRLFLVDGADVTKRATASQPQAEREEEQVLQEGHCLLFRCMAGVADGKDHRVLPFRGSKLTRILQHPLHYSAAGHGTTAVLFHIPQEEQLKEDAVCLLRSAALCKGTEKLDSISLHKDTILALRKQLEAERAASAALLSRTQAARALRGAKAKDLAHMQEELAAKDATLEARIAQTHRKVTRELQEKEVEDMDRMRREVLSEPQREYDAQRDFVRAWGPSVEADLTVVLDSEMQRRN